MQQQIDFNKIGLRFLSFFQRLLASLRDFWKNLGIAVEDYIRGKTKHIPRDLPKGRRAIVESILEHRHHQEFLQKFAQESGIAIDHVETTFRRYLHEIAADLNYLIIPFWDFLLTWVFDFLFDGFELDTSSLKKIRELSGKKPLVFVPNHRSHTDYLLLSYLFYNHRIPLPHVCAGANLSFWPLGAIGRKSGGFFIRRSYEGNKLYAKAVQAYIEELIRDKMNLEFFIEGGRSRTGKLLPPKMGILSAITQAFLNGASEDILLIPTSLSYDSIIEEKNYAEEQGGGSKKEESIWDLFKLQKYLKKKKGQVYLQFGEPISIREFFGDSAQKEKRDQVRDLAFELTYRINKSTVVTPASLTASAILTKRGRSISEKEVEEKVEGYLDYLRFKECRLSEPLQKSWRPAVRQALRSQARDHLIREYYDDGGPLYAVRDDRRPILGYYQNTAIHFLVSMGVLATILNSTPSGEIALKRVEEDYAFLQDLFRHEFTFSRRQPLRSHLEKLIGYLEERKIARFEEPFIRLSADRRGQLNLFSSPLRSTLEGYYILWRILPSLGERRWEVKDLLKFVLERGYVLYLKGEVSRPESVNKFVLQNALGSFRDLQLLTEEQEGWGKRKKIFYTVKKPNEEVEKQLNRLLASPDNT